MDIKGRKIAFIQEFLKLQNEEIIEGLESLLRSKKAELYKSTLKPMPINHLYEEIDEAMEDINTGNITKAKDLKAKYK